jgi:hypothetical protein
MVHVPPKYAPPRRADLRAWATDRLLLDAGLLAYSPRFADGVPPELKVTTPREAQILIERARPSFTKTLRRHKRLHRFWKVQGALS